MGKINAAKGGSGGGERRTGINSGYLLRARETPAEERTGREQRGRNSAASPPTLPEGCPRLSPAWLPPLPSGAEERCRGRGRKVFRVPFLQLNKRCGEMLERSGAGAVQPSGRGTDGFPCRALRRRGCPLRASHLLLRALGARHEAPPSLPLPHSPAAGRRPRYRSSGWRRGHLRAAPGALCAALAPR